MQGSNWDDLKFILAVVEEGSISAAAKLLEVNHATVLRRINAFEDRYGGPVFERTKHGYRLRPDRLQVIEAARHAAQHVKTAENLMRGTSAEATVTLRIASTDTLCQTVLPRIQAQLAHRIKPERIAILSSNAHLDMARLHADLAIRPALSLPEDLFGLHVADMRFGTYAQTPKAQPWLGLAGPLAKSAPAQWMAQNIPPDEIAASSDSFPVLGEMAALGQGKALLPRLIGDAHGHLVPVASQAPAFEIPVWVACHRDLAGSERLRSVMDLIKRLFEPLKPAMWGRG